MERLKNPKLIAALIVIALAVVIFYQNRGEVDLQVLFLGTLHTRIATALGLAFVAGMVTGALAFSRWKSQREKAKSASNSASP